MNQNREIRCARAQTGRSGDPSVARRWCPGGVAHATLAAVIVLVFVNVALVAVARAQLRPPPVRARGVSTGGQAPPAALPAVGLRVLRFVDRSRPIRRKGGRSEPRTLVTYVRYPALGAPGATDVPDAMPASSDGPYPLIVFGHGFAVTPRPYARLLQSWARAGYVVAAPVFPLGSAGAPGGPDEADVINQPSDVSFVISSMLALSLPGAGPLANLVDPTQVAVAGHSDGAETALAVAYSRRFRDRRVGAAVILSGAEMGGVGGYSFTNGPPLLAAQGTDDTFNDPKYTLAYFKRARRPKFLLRLIGAGHLPPYSYQQPQLAVVERVTIAFLNTYLKRRPGSLRQMISLGAVAGTSSLLAEP
jgi:dienelactone hydrolase